MKSHYLLAFLLFAASGIPACSPETDQLDEEEWIDDVEAWHSERIENLRQDDSWLTLAGLFWLEEGRNSFGSGSSNDIVFDFEEVPERFGWFTLDGDEIRVELDAESNVTIDNQPIENSIIYSDSMEEPAIMEWKNLSWYVISRSGQYAIRLRDREHPMLSKFDGIDRYPVSQEWLVRAEFIPFNPPLILTIPNYIGEPSQEEILGVLEFEIDGEMHRLYPVADNLDERFFIIFADETNGDETYSAGRFVYTDPPDQNNIVYIDFNRAYNPPCVFSPYATCPLPPPENRLSISVKAGELDFEI